MAVWSLCKHNSLSRLKTIVCLNAAAGKTTSTMMILSQQGRRLMIVDVVVNIRIFCLVNRPSYSPVRGVNVSLCCLTGWQYLCDCVFCTIYLELCMYVLLASGECWQIMIFEYYMAAWLASGPTQSSWLGYLTSHEYHPWSAHTMSRCWHKLQKENNLNKGYNNNNSQQLTSTIATASGTTAWGRTTSHHNGCLAKQNNNKNAQTTTK